MLDTGSGTVDRGYLHFLNLLGPWDGPTLDSREMDALICSIRLAVLALFFRVELDFFL